MRKKIIAVCGPTASGKTALAIALAMELNGEIISCDSMQLYRGMDIGTAKPTPDELAAVPHHLIDIADPDEKFSVADYKRLAEAAYEDIVSRGKTPVFCGGTGLYLDAVVTGNVFSSSDADPAFRDSLNGVDSERLHEMLSECDPEAAAAIHPNNRKRVIRALEIFHSTGVPKSEWDRRSHPDGTAEDAAVIMPDYPREVLYARIEKRVDAMMEQGLAGEALRLRNAFGETAAQAIGYKELYGYFDGSATLDEAIAAIKTATRNYAKRQLTWFRRRPYVTPLPVGEGDNFKNIVNNALKLLN